MRMCGLDCGSAKYVAIQVIKNNVSMLFGLREYEVRSNPSNKK